MSVKVMSLVWEFGPVDSTQRFVLLALADNASDDGGNAYPSIPTIAQKCALSERTVIRAIDGLIEDGYLKKRRRKDASNLYQIVLSALTEAHQSLWEVTNCHIRRCQDVTSHSDTVSLTGVTDCHQGGDTVSLDPSYNHPINHPKEGEGERSPARPTRYIRATEETPTVIERAPLALRLLHELTSYWPGDDNAPLLVAKLGDNPDRSALARAVELWRASGNRINNWLGIADWYQEIKSDPNWTPQSRFKPKSGNGHKQPAPALNLKPVAPGLY